MLGLASHRRLVCSICQLYRVSNRDNRQRCTLLGLQAIMEVCAVCNEARIECKEGVCRAVGAPTEAALGVLVEKAGVPDRATHQRIAAARQADPDTHPNGVQQWYSER